MPQIHKCYVNLQKLMNKCRKNISLAQCIGIQRDLRYLRRGNSRDTFHSDPHKHPSLVCRARLPQLLSKLVQNWLQYLSMFCMSSATLTYSQSHFCLLRCWPTPSPKNKGYFYTASAINRDEAKLLSSVSYTSLVLIFQDLVLQNAADFCIFINRVLILQNLMSCLMPTSTYECIHMYIYLQDNLYS